MKPIKTELRCLHIDKDGVMCGHVWIQRFPNKIPVACPRCKSYEWKGKKEIIK